MANEITQMNVADLVRDRVRQTMMESIPDDQIDKLIMAEWDKFFTPPSGYASDKRSQFERLVQTEIETKIKEMAKDLIAKKVEPIFNQWAIGGEAEESYDKMVRKMVPAVSEGYMMGLAQQVANNIQQANNNY